MALWQFIVFTGLIGALLVYASVLTRLLGYTNARLKRIEEALLVTALPIDFADIRAAKAKAEVSGKEGHVGYRTIRDLKVRSEQLSSSATRSSSPNSVAVPESREALNAGSKQVSSRGSHTWNGNSVSTSMASRGAPEMVCEPLSSPARRPVSSDAVATSSECRDSVEASGESLSSLSAGSANGTSETKGSESGDTLETTSGRQSPPNCRPPSEDSLAKKDRDALLMLSNQRRRRRARLGY